MIVALCAGCGDPQEPRGLRIAIPDPIVDLGVSDGCARFQVRFDAGGAPIVEPIFNSASCALNQIRLLSDTAATFDAATGALRVAIVMENLGTAAIVPQVRLRFNADSVTRLDANGNPVGGANDILGYQPDSASATGRIAFWRFDAYLAPVGQPQVLMPGARTQRRWVEFRGTTWSHRTRLKLFATGVEASNVPSVAPDSIPLREKSRLFYPTDGSAPYSRNLLIVRFRPGTLVAEKARVVGLVTGAVVGGYRDVTAEGGAYIIRVTGDSSSSPLGAALSLLSAQGSVLTVWRYMFSMQQPTYLRPNDGVSWRRSDWRVRGDSLLQPNALRFSWGIQYVRAPLAWGCSVGSGARVGVIDAGFRTTGLLDLPATYFRSSAVNLANDAERHGTQVLSVMAATGDNGLDITGMAWGATFGLADPTTRDTVSGTQPTFHPNGVRRISEIDVLRQIDSMALAGAHVINLSLGADSTAILNLQDTAQVNYWRGQLDAFAGNLRAVGRVAPLLVVSSGNIRLGNTDPRGSAWPLLKDYLPDHVLVVAAMKRDSTLLTAPPGSGYVDVVSPGDFIGFVDDQQMFGRSGASFAAPIVAGAAALLRGFDPRLPADSIRRLILDGAVRSQRTVGGYAVLDAYGALKLAAERPGAPLCGNRMWSDGSQLLVRRGTATEVIGTSTLLEPTIESYHGGRVAGFGGVRFLWQPNGSWAAGTLPGGSIPSGAWRSSVGASHDGDSTVSTTIGPVPVGGGHFDVIVDHFAGASLLSSRTVTSGNAGANTPVLAHVAYPTTGNTALVAVARGTITLPLPSPPVIALDAGTAYGLSLSTGQVSTLWVESGRGVLFLGYSEDGSEIVALVSSAYNAVGHPLVAMPSCKVTWRKVSAPAVVIDSASTPYGCQIDPIAGARTGGSAPRILPRRP